MKQFLSSTYGRDIKRVGLIFIALMLIKNLFEPMDNNFINGCLQGLIVGAIVLWIRFLINKRDTQ